MNASGYFKNILKSLSKEGLYSGDLNYGGYVNPIDAVLGRKPLDEDIIRAAETAREEEYYKRLGVLTADTKKAAILGTPDYIESIDPERAYYMFKTNEPYENIPSGYDVLGDRVIAPLDEIERQKQYQRIKDYALSYPNSRFTLEMLNELAGYLDPGTLARSVAASQAETGMGSKAYSFLPEGGLKNTNFYNLFVGGDKTYDPETLEEMAQTLNRNFGPGSPYSDFSNESAINKYTNNDKTSNWLRIVKGALSSMGY